MSRAASVEPEIVGRIDKADAEMVMPETIDDDAGEEGIFGGGDPVGELDAPLGVGGGGGKFEIGADAFDRGNAAGGELFARLLGVAADEEVGRAGIGGHDGVRFSPAGGDR